MSNSFEPETNPNVPWYHRGGFTTMAAISLILALVAVVALTAGAILGDVAFARDFVQFPAVVGLIFGILGLLGPWKVTAGFGVGLNIAAFFFAIFTSMGD